MKMYIGIDPSISCTGVFYYINGEYGCFYSAHNISKPCSSDLIEYISDDYKKIIKNGYICDVKKRFNIENIDEEYIENSFVRYNFISRNIVNKINEIIEKNNIDEIYICYENYSYGSKSGLAFTVAEFNKILKDFIITRISIKKHFLLISPNEIKKFASGVGNADKFLMYLSFLEKSEEQIKNDFLKTFNPGDVISNMLKKGDIIKNEEFYKNGNIKNEAKIVKKKKIVYKEINSKKKVIGKSPMEDLIDAYFMMKFVIDKDGVKNDRKIN